MTEINETQLANKLVSLAVAGVSEQISKKVQVLEECVANALKGTQEKIAAVEQLLDNSPTCIRIGTKEINTVKQTHKIFGIVSKILTSAKRKEKNIMLVGPAGGGKSYLASVIAEATNLPFHPMSVGIQTTKSDLMGFVNAMGNYVTSPVRLAFENGGVLLLDEFDAANAGVVTILNALLANEIVSFPDKTVKKHPNFICICACNTFGRGADVTYVGRNRLDGATLDRFITVTMDYDGVLERMLVGKPKWVEIIEKMRENAETAGIKHIISPRASMDGADLLDAGFNIYDVLEMVVFKGVEPNIKEQLVKGITLPPRPIVDSVTGKIVGYSKGFTDNTTSAGDPVDLKVAEEVVLQ